MSSMVLPPIQTLRMYHSSAGRASGERQAAHGPRFASPPGPPFATRRLPLAELQSRPMKRIAALTLLLFAACAKQETPVNSTTSSASGTSAAPAMKVGLLTPGSVNDNGWNAIAYDGLQQIKQKVGATASNQETRR